MPKYFNGGGNCEERIIRINWADIIEERVSSPTLHRWGTLTKNVGVTAFTK